MPKVGGKHFAYTPAGQAAAKREAAKMGKSVKRGSKRKKSGASGFNGTPKPASR